MAGDRTVQVLYRFMIQEMKRGYFLQGFETVLPNQINRASH